jgi:hypothetical protein
MVPSEAAGFDEQDDRGMERIRRIARPSYPCHNGTPKRTRHKKGAKKMRLNGNHRRRVRKMDW